MTPFERMERFEQLNHSVRKYSSPSLTVPHPLYPVMTVKSSGRKGTYFCSPHPLFNGRDCEVLYSECPTLNLGQKDEGGLSCTFLIKKRDTE